MIKIIVDNYSTEFEESESWTETKENCLGALHRVMLKRDNPNKNIVGVEEEDGN